ncbi:hypothetical protein ABIB38_002910 [Massilia sp. UYP11]|uniref:hypothetical protein n=1 Tax=Massilia sp. UYP11 TaxID=1756385 RepID=UPI003D22995A
MAIHTASSAQWSAQALAPSSGIIPGSIQPTNETAETMEAERINAISALLNDLTGREAELRRYL